MYKIEGRPKITLLFGLPTYVVILFKFFLFRGVLTLLVPEGNRHPNPEHEALRVFQHF